MYDPAAYMIIGILIGIALTGVVIERPSRRKRRFEQLLRAMDISEERIEQALEEWRP